MRIFTGIAIVLTAVLFSATSFAQPATVIAWGTVADAATRTPIEGAVVSFYPSGPVTTTNEQGRFSCTIKEAATQQVSISAIGHETKSMGYEAFVQTSRTMLLAPQAIQLKEVTVSGNTANPYSSISKIAIKMRGINNSQEILPAIPGLFIGQHAGGGKAEQIFLRGFDLDHGTDINLSVDGMPVNMVSHAHGQGYADLHFVIPELIDNVHFKKGPYDATRGNLATTGYADFRTKDALTSSLVKLEGGQFNTLRALGLLDLTGKKMQQKDQSLYVASEYMYTDGYFENPQHFNRLNVFSKFSGTIAPGNRLYVTASVFNSKWNASGQIPERAVNNGLISFFGAIDPNEGGSTARNNVNVQLNTQLKNGNVINNQLFYTQYRFELYSNFTFFNIDSINGDQIRQKENRHLLGYNGSYTNVRYAGTIKFTTEAGAMLRLDLTSNSELSRTKNKTTTLERLKLGDIRELNTGVYLQETIRLNQRFTANAGVRVDQFNMQYKDQLDNNQVSKADNAIVSPKLNLYYHVNQQLELYVTSGKGFHSNDTRVAVQTGDRQILPGAYGADLGTNWKPSPNLLLNAALWYLYLGQEFVYVGDEAVVEPSGKSRRQGIDLSIRYQPVSWLFIDADANYCKGRAIEEPTGADYLPLAPVYTSTGGILYKSKCGLTGSLRYRYMGNRPANEDNSVVAKGYFINDLVLNYSQRKFELGLTLQNLLNKKWKETQFDTQSRLKNEQAPVSEIHFTPGTPFFIKGSVVYYFHHKQ